MLVHLPLIPAIFSRLHARFDIRHLSLPAFQTSAARVGKGCQAVFPTLCAFRFGFGFSGCWLFLQFVLISILFMLLFCYICLALCIVCSLFFALGCLWGDFVGALHRFLLWGAPKLMEIMEVVEGVFVYKSRTG